MHPYHHPTYIISRAHVPLGAGLDQARVGDHVGAQPFPLDGGEHLYLIVVCCCVGWWVGCVGGGLCFWCVVVCVGLCRCVGWLVVLMVCCCVVVLVGCAHTHTISRVLVLCCGWYTYTYTLLHTIHTPTKDRRDRTHLDGLLPPPAFCAGVNQGVVRHERRGQPPSFLHLLQEPLGVLGPFALF